MIICEPLLIIREHGEALFELLKFMSLARTGRCLDQLAVFDRFRTILLGREHPEPFLCKPPLMPVSLDYWIAGEWRCGDGEIK